MATWSMIEAARLAQSYTAGFSKADFLVDRRTQQAVVLNLITIGEISARVMSEHAEFAGKFPNVPWRQMRGMRNRMAHGYIDINLDIIWDTVQNHFRTWKVSWQPSAHNLRMPALVRFDGLVRVADGARKQRSRSVHDVG